MATRPLGKEIQKRVQLMNMQYGPAGITIAQLKQAILGFLNLNQYSRPFARDRERDRPVVTFPPRSYQTQNRPPAFTARREGQTGVVREKDTKLHVANISASSKPASEVKTVNTRAGSVISNGYENSYKRRKIGIGPTPCYVCGSDKHPWVECSKKKKGKCACCGSEAHLTRWCAQRFFPQLRMSFNQCMMDPEQRYNYIPENEPVEDGEYEEYEIETKQIAEEFAQEMDQGDPSFPEQEEES